MVVAAICRADTIELANGNKVEGTVLENNADTKTLTIEFNLGGTLSKRSVPYASVKAIIVNGTRTDLQAPASATTRTPAEVQAHIAKVGSTEPDWMKSTKLNYPKTLDITWPEGSPQGGWNNQKNVGQFIWDIINPNSSRWQEGLKLMYHILDSNPDASLKARVTKEIANMHFRLFQDYARAAWWWQQVGITMDEGLGTHLAECYWRLGSKQMALDLLAQSEFMYLDSIKLLGDMLETDRAVEMAENYDDHGAWLLAGDACRLVGRNEQAQSFYERVITTPATDGKPERLKRTQNRAQANLSALQLFDLSEVSKVTDGTYKESSLGYEGQVEVTVKVRGKKIEDVKVTQHKEKQYYSALTDVPAQIIAKQGVKGVDATSRATITGEAIINATAKALAQGAQ